MERRLTTQWKGRRITLAESKQYWKVDDIVKDMNMSNNLMIEIMIRLRYIKYALSQYLIQFN